MIEPSIDNEFLNNFDVVYNDVISNNNIKFLCPLIDSYKFNYDGIIEKLLSYVHCYCLSRTTLAEYKNNPMKISQLARSKFRDLEANDGEIAELFGFSLLESDLRAPKIISKMELKTSNNMYFNGADGVHFLKTEDGHQLIFVEAKTYDDFYKGIYNAILSIEKFKTNKIKDKKDGKLKGIKFEKDLISANLLKETFTEEDRKFVKYLLYPTRNEVEFNGNVDTAFSIVLLYDPKIPKDFSKSPLQEYRKKVKNLLKETIESNLRNIENLLKKHNLSGHKFYIYIVPLDNFEQDMDDILQGVVG